MSAILFYDPLGVVCAEASLIFASRDWPLASASYEIFIGRWCACAPRRRLRLGPMVPATGERPQAWPPDSARVL